MKKCRIILRSVKEDGNPQKSGNYLAFTENGEYVIQYSVVHSAWNVNDRMTEEAAKRFRMDTVTAWAYIGNIAQELRYDRHHAMP